MVLAIVRCIVVLVIVRCSVVTVVLAIVGTVGAVVLVIVRCCMLGVASVLLQPPPPFQDVNAAKN